MNSKYTPTTEQVRKAYGFSNVPDGSAEFDRWLAGVVADAKAEQREADARKAQELAREALAIRNAYVAFWGAHSSRQITDVGREPKMPKTPALDAIRAVTPEEAS